jgi:hypothetical protein
MGRSRLDAGAALDDLGHTIQPALLRVPLRGSVGMTKRKSASQPEITPNEAVGYFGRGRLGFPAAPPTPSSDKPIFRSAVTGDDGEVDAGYLAMYVITAIVAGAIPVMCVAAVIAMVLATDHKFSAQELGIGIGSVCTGLGVAIGAVGAFRMGDKPHAGTVVTASSSESSQTVTPAGAPIAKA